MTAKRNTAFGDRLFTAWKHCELSEGHDLSLAWIGERVAETCQRTPPYASATVRKWRKGTVPEPYVQRAIAQVFGVREEWLMEGKGPREGSAPPVLRVRPDARGTAAAAPQKPGKGRRPMTGDPDEREMPAKPSSAKRRRRA